MDDLIDYPLNEPANIRKLRSAARAGADDDVVALGMALAKSGCSHEAAILLRPLRAKWKTHSDAEAGRSALEVQTWYNKTWKHFAQLKQAGKIDQALDLLGDRAPQFWDQPPILMHLGGFAVDQGKLNLAEHIFRRIAYLADRGVPKVNMTAFVYAAQAALLDVLAARGNAVEALKLWRKLEANPGNAMAQQLQGASLMAAAGVHDEALQQVARILVTAQKERKGYSRDVRQEFADNAPDLAHLRKHKDWATMRADPAAFLKSD